MGIADFFRPKYRHSDVRVRTEAIRALGKDDAAILEQIARSDRDIGVRRLALEKIDAPSTLATLASEETERSLRELATGRAAELYASAASAGDNDALSGIIKLGDQHALVDVVVRSENAAIRKRAFGELRDPRALQDLARSDAAQDIRISAVTRIDDGDVLRALAIDVTQKEVGLAAVDKLDDIDRLENVAQKAKNKAVRQRARKIVAEIHDAEKAKAAPVVPDEVKRRRAEKAQLIREVETLSESFDFAKAAAQLATAQETFGKLPPEDGDERFTKAIERFARRKKIHDQTARSADELRQVERDARAQKEREAAERAARAEAEKQVSEAAAVPDPEAEAKQAAREAEAAARREEQAKLRAEDDARRAAQQAEREVRQKEQAERSIALGASLTAMVEDMEKLAETGDARAIDRVLTQSAKAFSDIGKVPPADRDSLADRYQAARGKLVIKASEKREAEDWERWSNVPKAEALIKTANEMALEEPSAELGNRLRGLQALWKEVGPMPSRRSKELWDTFKVACDGVYEKVRGVRAVENEKFADVAKAKEALIAEAEALATSTEWATTAEKLKALQTQWKSSGHLPRKQGDELWKRFRTACDKFFEARKPQLDARRDEEAANLAKKHQLIARAQQVADKAPNDGGWGKAIGTIKDLQAEWKEIGYVARKDADVVYKAFRAACDALFAKRDASRDVEANAHRAEIDAVQAQLAAVLAGEGDVVATGLAARAKAQELGVLQNEVDAMVRHLVAAHAEALKGTDLDPAAAKGRRAKLVSKAEELLPKDAPVLPAGDDIASRLKNAMRANAFGDLRFSGRDPREVVDELRAAWRDAGPLFDAEDQAQLASFDAVIAKVLEAAGPKHGDDRPARRERRERRPELETTLPSVPVVHATPDAVTRPVSMPSAESGPVVAAPVAKPATIPPPMEEVDGGWDLGEDDPSSTPSAAEMASDGAPPDSLSDD